MVRHGFDTIRGVARLGRARRSQAVLGKAEFGKAGQGKDFDKTPNHRSTASGPLAADPRGE